MRAFATATLAVLLISVVARVEFGLAIVLLIGVVVFVGFVVPRRVEQGLEADRSFVNRAFHGDRVPVTLTVRNHSLLPAVWVEVRESLPLAIAPSYESVKSVVSIPARDERLITYEVHGRRRGYWVLGPATFETGDVLGISRRRAPAKASQHLIVYPKIVPLRRLGLPTRSPLAALPARSSLFADPARVIGVKEYQVGDSPRTIHWTATARTGDMLVKQLEPAVARETMICLDLNRRNYSYRHRISGPELAITLAASLASHIVTQEKQPAGLTTRARDPLAGKVIDVVLSPEADRGSLMVVLEYLARLQTEGESDFAGLLRASAPRLTWGSTIAVVTGSVGRGLMESLLMLRHSGFAVALYLVQADRSSEELTSAFNALGVRVYRVDREEEIGLL